MLELDGDWWATPFRQQEIVITNVIQIWFVEVNDDYRGGELMRWKLKCIPMKEDLARRYFYKLITTQNIHWLFSSPNATSCSSKRILHLVSAICCCSSIGSGFSFVLLRKRLLTFCEHIFPMLVYLAMAEQQTFHKLYAFYPLARSPNPFRMIDKNLFCFREW